MSTTSVMLSKEELDTARLTEIFRQAFLDVQTDADGDLMLTMDGVKIWPLLDASRGLMALRSGLNVKPETTRQQVLELSNRINDGLVFIRACCPSARIVLWLDHYLDTNAGLTPEEIIDEARRFRSVLTSIIPLDTDHILA